MPRLQQVRDSLIDHLQLEVIRPGSILLLDTRSLIGLECFSLSRGQI